MGTNDIWADDKLERVDDARFLAKFIRNRSAELIHEGSEPDARTSRRMFDRAADAVRRDAMGRGTGPDAAEALTARGQGPASNVPRTLD